MGSENYLSWADSIDLWFIGNGCEDHLTTLTQVSPKINVLSGEKTHALLCNILRQSIDAKNLLHALELGEEMSRPETHSRA